MKKSELIAAALVGLLGATGAQAAEVICGNSTLGVRTTTVDPGLAGGLCHAQNGNLQMSDITALGLTFIAKEETSAGDVATPLIGYEITGRESGTWNIAPSLWASWSRLFLGFHFGGAGDKSDTNPDSFVIELARADVRGDWALTGTSAFKISGLSNIQIIGKDRLAVPEPGTLALAGLALLGLAVRRSRA